MYLVRDSKLTSYIKNLISCHGTDYALLISLLVPDTCNNDIVLMN